MYDLEELFLFRGIPADRRAKLLSALRDTVSFEKGETIYDAEHFRHSVGVMLSGKAYAGDLHATKAFFSAGDVFGAAAVFGAGEEYVSSITARTACTVLFLSEETLLSLFAEYPVCAVNYIGFLTEKVRYLNRKIAQYTGDDAASRLYRLLCDKADADGCVTDVNMSVLAGLAGMGRTSVYRAVSELEQNGSVVRDGKKIYIRG